MKKILSILLILVIAFSFAACNQPQGDPVGEATIIVHTETDTEYTVELSKVGEPYTVIKALDYLKAEKGLELVYTNESWGAYITQVGSLKEDKANYKYVMFWTSVEEDFDVVSEYATEKTVKETKLVSSAVGVSTAVLRDGAIIYFSFD